MNVTTGTLHDKATNVAHEFWRSLMNKSGVRELRMLEKLGLDIAKAIWRVGIRCDGRPLVVW